MADNGHPFAGCDSQCVEACGDLSGPVGDVRVGECAPGRCGLVGLVDDADSVGVDLLGASEEIVDGQGDMHGRTLRVDLA